MVWTDKVSYVDEVDLDEIDAVDVDGVGDVAI